MSPLLNSHSGFEACSSMSEGLHTDLDRDTLILVVGDHDGPGVGF